MMTQDSNDDGAWFAPKRFGYGSGLPITWQGWFVLLGFTAAVIGIEAVAGRSGRGMFVAAQVIVALLTGVLFVVTARHTRGGWKWRWGGKDTGKD